MPAESSDSSPISQDEEAGIFLAVEAMDSGKIESAREAARAFNVSRVTLQRRISGLKTHVNAGEDLSVLSKSEEARLVQWILSIHSRGFSPSQNYVRGMVETLLANRGMQQYLPIGQNWVVRFLKKHPGLFEKTSKLNESQRAKLRDKRVFESWFNVVRDTMEAHKIDPGDVYNADVTKLAISRSPEAAKVQGSGNQGSGNQGGELSLEDDRQDWVSTIECINAVGQALYPFITFKGKRMCKLSHTEIPSHWNVAVSDTGTVSSNMAICWLKTVFIPHTKNSTRSGHRILLLNGQGCHLAPEFDQLCSENGVIALYMPPLSSLYLQPLDLYCYKHLRAQFYLLESEKPGYTSGSVCESYSDFIDLYNSARDRALTADNITSSFERAGLVPYDPDSAFTRIESELNAENTEKAKPISARHSRDDTESMMRSNMKFLDEIKSSTYKILDNPAGLQVDPLRANIKLLFDFIKSQTEGSKDMAKRLSEELSTLENDEIHKKRSMRNAFEAHDDEEGSNIRTGKGSKAAQTTSHKKRRSPRCGICGQTGHRRQTCATRGQ